MKKILVLAACAAMFFACGENGPEGGEEQDNAWPAAPKVEFTEITASSFTASWAEISGADAYRYEVTRETASGREVIEYDGNYTSASFTVTGLEPACAYNVRVAARSEGITSTNWFTGTVTTGGTSLSLSIVPVEKYYDGYVHPAARVTASDEDVYYWVSAFPEDSGTDAYSWIVEDISYYESNGWDSLVSAGLIMHGSGVSVGFNFTGYGTFQFVAAPVSLTADGIAVSENLFYGPAFYAVSTDTAMPFPSTMDDFVGEWVATTYSTLVSSGGYFVEDEGTSFPVTITAKNGSTLEMTGWGGENNRFAQSPIVLDYSADGNYGSFDIALPQDISTDSDGTVWKYYSWFTFSDGAGSYYYRFDPDDFSLEAYPEMATALKNAFTGFVANRNKTVIKIVGTQLTATDGSGFVVNSLWPYGTASDGTGTYLNGKHEEPFEIYFLVRKDVADGLVLEIPEE